MEEVGRREKEKEEAEFQKGNYDGVMCPPRLQVAVVFSLCLSP